jgi:cbb3-type cytochrome oxidase subunit 3
MRGNEGAMSKNGVSSSVVKSIVLVIFGAIFVLGIYFVLTRGKKAPDEESYQLTVIDEITTTNLDKNYPADARKVVELYAKTMKVLYNEKYSDDQQKKMLDVLAGIMDDELLANQTDFYKSMSNEIKNRKDEKYSFSTYQVQNFEPEVVTVQGSKMCDVDCFFSLMQESTRINMYYTFYMRRDSEKRWKILGWDIKQE